MKIKEKCINLLKEWWNSDLVIECNKRNKFLIFDLDNDSYWDHFSNKWIFSGKRILVPADGKEYEKFNKYLEENGYLYKSYTLEEAIELVEKLF